MLDILGYIFGLGLIVCLILVILKMFQNGAATMGIVTIATSVVCCLTVGPVIALIYGWMKARDWNMKNLMIAYTLCFVGAWALTGIRVPYIIEQVQTQMKQQGR